MRRSPKLTIQQVQQLQDIINNPKSSGKEVRRAQAVSLLDQDAAIKMIIALTRYSRRQIFDLRKNYLDQGITAILDKKKGKPKELLTRKQREDILAALKDKTPKDYDYDNDYWTAWILGDFIKQQYDVKYKSKTSFYLIFRQAKFTYHKPGRQYHLRDEQEVAKWRKMARPLIKQAMEQSNTVVLAEDEMLLSTQTTFQKIWLPQGQYPKIEISNKRENRSVYGFLNIKTGTEHAFLAQRQNMYITRDILKEIRKIYSAQKLLILWDGAGWHRGSQVQNFIKQDKNIQTIYFPRYSPEENPQEHVWKNGRGHITHNEFIKEIDTATNKFIDYLNETRFSYSLLGFNAES